MEEKRFFSFFASLSSFSTSADTAPRFLKTCGLLVHCYTPVFYRAEKTGRYLG